MRRNPFEVGTNFDREMSRMRTVFWALFVVAGLVILGIWGSQLYLVVRFGPKLLHTADKALDKANTYMDKE